VSAIVGVLIPLGAIKAALRQGGLSFAQKGRAFALAKGQAVLGCRTFLRAAGFGFAGPAQIDELGHTLFRLVAFTKHGFSRNEGCRLAVIIELVGRECFGQEAR
jgi:hypothetical protein